MNEKTKQILAYVFGPIAGLIFFLLNDSSKETKYHAAQSMTIGALAFLLSFIPIVNIFVGIAALVFAILGIIRAVNEEDPKIPLISNLVDLVFSKEFAKESETQAAKEVDAEVVSEDESKHTIELKFETDSVTPNLSTKIYVDAMERDVEFDVIPKEDTLNLVEAIEEPVEKVEAESTSQEDEKILMQIVFVKKILMEHDHGASCCFLT